jgi:transposase
VSADTVKLRNNFDEAMGDVAYKHGDLVRKLAQVMGKSEETAKKLIGKAKAAGIIELNLKHYRFIRPAGYAEDAEDETLFER